MPESVFPKRDTPAKRALVEALTSTDKTGLHEMTVAMLLDTAAHIEPHSSRNSFYGPLGNLIRERLVTVVGGTTGNIPSRNISGKTTIATSSEQRRNLSGIVRNWDRARVRSVAR